MASFDVDPGQSSLAGPATPVYVYRYDSTPAPPPDDEEDDAPPKSPYTLLPNVHCENVAEREGSEPATAQFSYLLDNTFNRDRGWPCEFEDLWPMQGAPSKYRVKQDDRIVVIAQLPDDSQRLLFDGFVTSPQADVSADTQQVTFGATSVEIRCWDAPIDGRWQRNGNSDVGSLLGDLPTGLPTRFNPGGKPNRTGDAGDSDPGGKFPHPIFTEIRYLEPHSLARSTWTLATAAKYLLARYNRDEEYVDNPDFGVMEDLLNNRAPKDGGSYDPNDPDTYDEKPVTLGDYDCGNRPWPEPLGELLGYYGFGMRFRGELDETNKPWHVLEIYRRDQAGPTEPKSLLLPKTGSDVDPDAVNVGAFHVAHDFHGVANEIEIETEPRRFEVSVVLAPGFTPTAGDGTSANSAKYLMSAVDGAADDVRNKYRLYVADELGEGHWSTALQDWSEFNPIILTDLFPGFKLDDGTEVRGYVERYRPGSRNLITLDEAGEPLKASLHVSRDYAGATPPALWDGTGHWQPITASWELLDDKLGIYITAEDLRQWKLGEYKGANVQVQSKILNAISPVSDPLGQPSESYRPFSLRLTTVVEGDFGIKAVAEKRRASPIGFTIRKRVDARDHYRYREVSKFSAFYDADELDEDGKDVVVDDTDAAKEQATQLRAAHEFPPIAGSVTIPHLDFSIDIGDRIKSINGRDVSLQVNGGSEAGEAKSYPFVVARTFNNSGDQQSTVLQLSDRRAEPAPIARRRG